ncbi:hypothetical protein ACGC1H_006227 [Rhizoctonia solani]|uniref:Uncharacterized protein n=1 Tax=Rhizoctonia solani TaxID=456999 RepID=A0A8H3CA53_9AGAM|nr:unnamed protein product [Rhizoctonia solani]
MYIPNVSRFLLSVLSIPSSQPVNQPTGELTQHTSTRVPATFDLCPQLTIRCVKDGDWPKGIVGDIGKKDFCWHWPRCNQCDIAANTDECNLTFPECENACDAFAPIPF